MPLRSALDVRGTLNVWAARAGMSTRTMERAIRRETGMSFGHWRQQLAVILAVKWLADGASIQKVAVSYYAVERPALRLKR